MSGGAGRPRVLLVQPVIHDYAAYDFWARPLGLLWVGGLLRSAGASPELLDCTDPTSPWLPRNMRPRRHPQGHGKFLRSRLDNPRAPQVRRRRFARYGLTPELIRRALARMARPDAVLVGSGMTYWYGGVAETIALVRQRWPGVTVLLGGTYASLVPEHARRHSGADQVLSGPADQRLLDTLNISTEAPVADWLPVHDLREDADSAALTTSTGCPHRCPYCGVELINRRYRPRDPALVQAEAALIAGQTAARDLAIYDDALLADEARAVEVLQRLSRVRPRLRLHAASGLSCRGVTREVARAMKRADVRTVRLGLETADAQAQKALGGKVTTDEFRAAVANLLAEGHEVGALGAYLLVGLPGQERAEVERAVDLVLAEGIRPHLAEYSPVPGSRMFEAARAAATFDLDDPLHHNPTLLPCAGPELTRDALEQIRDRVRRTLS